MAIHKYFPKSYIQGREEFTRMSKASKAAIVKYSINGKFGLSGELLSTDVSILGKSDAENVLIIVSGTHGVEGFAGSGCQIGFLANNIQEGFSKNSIVILIHALNPFGFSWFRRVNENNVDINRNFQNFDNLDFLKENSKNYEEIHSLLVPEDWVGLKRKKTDCDLEEFKLFKGLTHYQSVLTRGQYSVPNGLFFGGNQEEWSNITLRRILDAHIPKSTQRIAIVDIHTGLGPYGYGELMFLGNSETSYKKAIDVLGADVRAISLGQTQSSIVTGSVAEVYNSLDPSIEVIPIGLEFGTKSISEVINALRADHWLHAIPDRETVLRKKINKEIIDAFFVNSHYWKASVFTRTMDIILRFGRLFFK